VSAAAISHAMILAAGRGERMRPLTDTLPKPLAGVRGRPLIVYHLEKLARLGVRRVAIHYSDEGAQALDVGGGIFHALPWLGEAPFLVISADIFTELDFAALAIAPGDLAQLSLVHNPEHHRQGDFDLAADGRVLEPTEPAPRPFTYAGIGLFRRELFQGCEPGKFPLLPLLRRAIAARRLGGQVHEDFWCNVGTLVQLAALQHGAIGASAKMSSAT
jgi:MurNAc alpha-1-phosphate uridylyltransferase